jgi:hypothetical protein
MTCPALRLEVRQHFLHPVEGGLDVEAHDVIEVRVSEARGRAGNALSHIVDPHVDLAEPLKGLPNDTLNALSDRDVSREG